MRKAYELRGRTSQMEQLSISSLYDDLVTGNLEAAQTTYDLWAQMYPRDSGPHANLMVIYVAWVNMREGPYSGAEAPNTTARKWLSARTW